MVKRHRERASTYLYRMSLFCRAQHVQDISHVGTHQEHTQTDITDQQSGGHKYTHHLKDKGHGAHDANRLIEAQLQILHNEEKTEGGGKKEGRKEGC